MPVEKEAAKSATENPKKQVAFLKAGKLNRKKDRGVICLQPDDDVSKQDEPVEGEVNNEDVVEEEEDDVPDPNITVVNCTYCPFCEKKQRKMSEHLRFNHLEEQEVIEIKALQKGLEKTKRLDALKKRGNFAHNQGVIKEGAGVFAVMTPGNERQPKNYRSYDYCRKCFGYYTKSGLERHHEDDRCGTVPRYLRNVPENLEQDHSEKIATGNATIPRREVVGRNVDQNKLQEVTSSFFTEQQDEVKKGLIIKDPLLVNFIYAKLTNKRVKRKPGQQEAENEENKNKGNYSLR